MMTIGMTILSVLVDEPNASLPESLLLGLGLGTGTFCLEMMIGKVVWGAARMAGNRARVVTTKWDMVVGGDRSVDAR